MVAFSPGAETQRADLLLQLFRSTQTGDTWHWDRVCFLEAGGKLEDNFEPVASSHWHPKTDCKATFKETKRKPHFININIIDFCQGKTVCLYLFAETFITQMGGVKGYPLQQGPKKSPNIQIFELGVLTQITSQNFNLISRICHLAEGDTHHVWAIWAFGQRYLSLSLFFFF